MEAACGFPWRSRPASSIRSAGRRRLEHRSRLLVAGLNRAERAAFLVGRLRHLERDHHRRTHARRGPRAPGTRPRVRPPPIRPHPVVLPNPSLPTVADRPSRSRRPRRTRDGPAAPPGVGRPDPGPRGTPQRCCSPALSPRLTPVHRGQQPLKICRSGSNPWRRSCSTSPVRAPTRGRDPSRCPRSQVVGGRPLGPVVNAVRSPVTSWSQVHRHGHVPPRSGTENAIAWAGRPPDDSRTRVSLGRARRYCRDTR